MVTREGHAKILNFGLAKLVSLESAAHSDKPVSEVATALMQRQSTPGVVLGTVGYMSPEQAQGKSNEIDHRSDIFSFRCILYDERCDLDSRFQIAHMKYARDSECFHVLSTRCDLPSVNREEL